jgi:hypothetical protein
MFKSLFFLITCSLGQVACFVSPAFHVKSSTKAVPLFSNGSDELESMRRLLQTSWDEDTMGQVPSDAAVAANEAHSSILSAVDRGVSVFFIDLLLPAYDVTQGSNLYDEVLSVEYCIALANCLKGKSSILVRDEKTMQVVSRILEARESDTQAIQAAMVDDENEEDIHDDDKKLDDQVDDEENDDAEDEEEDEGPSQTESSSDVDLFRQQLMAGWEGDDSATDDVVKADVSEKPVEPVKPKKEKAPAQTPLKRHRLASMFGKSVIAEGVDMMNDVVEALRANALLAHDEENLIILSAMNRDEMIAVRSLVAKYEGQKKVVLVNCKLDPIPRELFGSETVYSLLPLIAPPKGGTEQAGDDTPPPPKIVVLRRYPKDWEVYVDVGEGFQLAETAPSNLSNKRGPPMEWVGACVQRFLQSR